jgi:DNA-binding NarL/FixJ family response regulator
VWHDGDPRRATALLEECLRLKVQLNDLLGCVFSMEALAYVAASEHQDARAAVLLGASAALAHDAGSPAVTFPNLRAHAECERQARSALGGPAFEAAVARGRNLSFVEAVAFALVEQPRPAGAPADNAPVLTRREQEVAGLVAQGMTHKAIAAKLFISPRTAQGHVENILSKLAFTSRSQVVAWFITHGEKHPG